MRDGVRISEVRPLAYAEMALRHYREAIARSEPTIYRIRLVLGPRDWTYERTSLPLVAGNGTPAMVLNLSLWDGPKLRSFWTELRASGLLD